MLECLRVVKYLRMVFVIGVKFVCYMFCKLVIEFWISDKVNFVLID